MQALHSHSERGYKRSKHLPDLLLRCEMKGQVDRRREYGFPAYLQLIGQR